MLSMTGFGRGRCVRDGREITIELKTVNHRFLDIGLHLPKSLLFLESEMRTQLQNSLLKRGHADLTLTYVNMRDDAVSFTINHQLVAALLRETEQTEALRGCSPLTAAEALSLSGALQAQQAQEDNDALLSIAAEALSVALEELQAMRVREGAHLHQDLSEKLSELAAIREQIAQRAPLVPQLYRERLTERLKQWQVDGVEPQRIAQEVAIMADKCAIDEELSRLEGHIRQFETICAEEQEAGKKLDFLVQEMNREMNTIGSKASDAEIIKQVVAGKCVIEKLREQIQNAV